MKNRFLLLVFLSFLGNLTLFAADPDSTATVEGQLNEEQMRYLYEAFVDSIEQTLSYETGTINIGDGLASLSVPSAFKYLNGSESEMILTDIWGNPPSAEGEGSLGMLIPRDQSPMEDSSYVVNILFIEEGYINDSDAKELDFENLLKTMQEDTREANPYRVEMGYSPVELIGWASTPFYDAESKKIHWAKELRFGEEIVHTLNYNIRILGRRGYLELNVIGEMYHLDAIKRDIGTILSSVDFQEGHAYDDFNPSLDKVAAYGIGGLIAGKVLLKAGLLAKLGLFFAKFWKIIAVAGVGLLAGARKLFKRKTEESGSTGLGK